MDMQDREFDKIFREKLDCFESEPSAGVWPGIVSGLNGNKRRNTPVWTLRIAASIIVLIAAGVLFFPKKREQGQGHTAKQLRAAIIQRSPVPVMEQGTVKPKTSADDLDKQHEMAVGNAPAHLSKIALLAAGAIVSGPAVDIRQTETTTPPENRPEMLSAVAPDDRTQIEAKQMPDNQAAFVNKPVSAAIQMPVATANIAPVKTAHKIRSFGDLVNVVVAKIDKRKDKVIEFSDDDDGSSVTAVNLGIIKIRREK
jgi:hypothetical protein